MIGRAADGQLLAAFTALPRKHLRLMPPLQRLRRRLIRAAEIGLRAQLFTGAGRTEYRSAWLCYQHLRTAHHTYDRRSFLFPRRRNILIGRIRRRLQPFTEVPSLPPSYLHRRVETGPRGRCHAAVGRTLFVAALREYFALKLSQLCGGEWRCLWTAVASSCSF